MSLPWINYRISRSILNSISIDNNCHRTRPAVTCSWGENCYVCPEWRYLLTTGSYIRRDRDHEINQSIDILEMKTDSSALGYYYIENQWLVFIAIKNVPLSSFYWWTVTNHCYLYRVNELDIDIAASAILSSGCCGLNDYDNDDAHSSLEKHWPSVSHAWIQLWHKVLLISHKPYNELLRLMNYIAQQRPPARFFNDAGLTKYKYYVTFSIIIIRWQ